VTSGARRIIAQLILHGPDANELQTTQYGSILKVALYDSENGFHLDTIQFQRGSSTKPSQCNFRPPFQLDRMTISNLISGHGSCNCNLANFSTDG